MTESDCCRDKEPGHPLPGNRKKPGNTVRLVLYGAGLLLLCFAGFLTYRSVRVAEPVEEEAGIKPPRVLQIDVLNGCGVRGVGSKFTDYLRSRGFDVVESKNYKSFQVPHTLIVDRMGDLAAARRVAEALGVAEINIIQEINFDYFVDVSVIIGKDFSELGPSR